MILKAAFTKYPVQFIFRLSKLSGGYLSQSAQLSHLVQKTDFPKIQIYLFCAVTFYNLPGQCTEAGQVEWVFGTPSGPHHQNDPLTDHSKLMAKESKREIHHWWCPAESRWLRKPKDIQFCKKQNHSLLFVTQATHKHEHFSSKCQDQSCWGNRVN